MKIGWSELIAKIKEVLADGIDTAITTTGNVSAAAGTFTGDLSAAGGFRSTVGPWTVAALAAGQTDTAAVYGIASMEFIAPRAGSIVGISAQIDAAITGASQSVQVKAAINGTALVSGPEVDFTQAGGEVKGQATAAKDTHAFAAGDRISIVYDSDTITNTPALVAQVEVEF